MYQKEVEEQAARVAKMKESGADEYDIRKQVNHTMLNLSGS